MDHKSTRDNSEPLPNMHYNILVPYIETRTQLLISRKNQTCFITLH